MAAAANSPTPPRMSPVSFGDSIWSTPSAKDPWLQSNKENQAPLQPQAQRAVTFKAQPKAADDFTVARTIRLAHQKIEHLNAQVQHQAATLHGQLHEIVQLKKANQAQAATIASQQQEIAQLQEALKAKDTLQANFDQLNALYATSLNQIMTLLGQNVQLTANNAQLQILLNNGQPQAVVVPQQLPNG